MIELLKSIKLIFTGFYNIAIRGLFNLDNPLLSLLDYIGWLNAIIIAITKLLKKRRH